MTRWTHAHSIAVGVALTLFATGHLWLLLLLATASGAALHWAYAKLRSGARRTVQAAEQINDRQQQKVDDKQRRDEEKHQAELDILHARAAAIRLEAKHKLHGWWTSKKKIDARIRQERDRATEETILAYRTR